jgi:hypothetical protein
MTLPHPVLVVPVVVIVCKQRRTCVWTQRAVLLLPCRELCHSIEARLCVRVRNCQVLRLLHFVRSALFVLAAMLCSGGRARAGAGGGAARQGSAGAECPQAGQHHCAEPMRCERPGGAAACAECISPLRSAWRPTAVLRSCVARVLHTDEYAVMQHADAK